MRIDSFTGPYRWLSNFWECDVWYDGVLYRSVEHAYQAAKSEDPVHRLTVQAAPTAGMAKRTGRDAVLRLGWVSMKDQVMKELLYQKYSGANPTLRDKLVLTGDAELVEGNSWGDTYWGVCRGRGQNRLGKMLMQIRAELISELRMKMAMGHPDVA